MSEAGELSERQSAEHAWLAVSDGLLRGVGHELSNRLAALSGVVQVLTSRGSGGPLEAVLADEMARLQGAVEVLRLLPRRWDEPPEPVRVEEVAKRVLELMPLHPALAEVRYRWEREEELLPVWIEPSLLAHALCVLLAAAGEEVARDGGGEVVLRGSGTEEMVSLQVHPGAGNPHALAPLLASAGGAVRVESGPDGALCAELRLPSLLEVRRRERAAPAL